MANSTDRSEQLKRLSPTKRELLVRAMREEAARRGVARRPARGPLVEIQPRGTRPPFFCVHPSGGNVLCYAALSRHLGAAQPFYGLQARGLDGASAPLTRVEEMAAQYVGEVRRVACGRPVFLGGWSMGGVVAFEMARQLRALGGEVALLALIDSRVAPRAGAPAQEDDDVTLLLGLARDLGLAPEEFGLTREELLPLSPDGQLAAILSRVDESHRLLSGLGIEAVRRMFDVFKSNLRALRGYAPQVYAGRVTLFRAAERGEWGPPGGTMSWDAWAAGGVQTCPVPGDHYTMMREPHVRVLAENLARHLARAA